MTRDPRRAYRVVDAFEDELCDYTGAPYAVAVNSCTNALFLSLEWEYRRNRSGDLDPLLVPKCTYVGVLQAALNAGYIVQLEDIPWQTDYVLHPSWVVDSARSIYTQMWKDHDLLGAFICLSFHAAKQLPLGRGGAILTDNEEAADWFRAARMDGRPPGSPWEATIRGWHMPMAPDTAARGLDILSRWNDTGWSPPPLPPTAYPDLSTIYPALTA